MLHFSSVIPYEYFPSQVGKNLSQSLVSHEKEILQANVFLASRKCKKRQLKMYADILSLFTCYLIWIACICGFRR